jgi:hypothetical protein
MVVAATTAADTLTAPSLPIASATNRIRRSLGRRHESSLIVRSRTGNRVRVTRSTLVMPTLDRLDDLTRLVTRASADDALYVRWSAGPTVDLRQDDVGRGVSRDSLTGVPLPGLSANPLAVEPWWEGRPVRLWVARKLYDYQHLRELRGAHVVPWLLVGEQCGRGPDNEPLVRCRRPIAWIGDGALDQARCLVDAQQSTEWGPLDRRRPRRAVTGFGGG